MARKTIVQLRVEVHVPDATVTPEELQTSVIEGLGELVTTDLGGMLLVIRANAFIEPVQDAELPMEPDPVPVPQEPVPE